MKKIIALFLILVISIWCGVHISRDPGYVLIALANWTIETPLWFAIILLLLGYILFHGFTRLLKSTSHVGRSLQHWRSKHYLERAHRRTRLGLIEFSEGNWQEAEQNLIKAIPPDDTALINYLAAARAAQEQGAPNRRDQYLREAQRAMPDAKIAVELTQAQLQITYEQWEQALATLKHLLSLAPNHPYVLKLLLKVYLSLKDWDNLAKLLPVIKRKKVLDAKDLEKMEFNVYEGLLEQAAKKLELTILKQTWQQFPNSLQKQPALLAVYAKYLLDKADTASAELCLMTGLKRKFDNQLIELYGRCQAQDAAKQLKFAESFLKHNPNNPHLLLALGKICMRNQLWGKAKTYLSNSAQLAPKLETYAELAKLLEQLDETQAAAECYRKGVEIALSASINCAKASEKLPNHFDKMFLAASKVAI